jgi:transposase
MAYKEHGMWEVLDVLKRVHRGEKRRAITRATGRSKKTIQRYVSTARGFGWDPGSPNPPDEDLAARVLHELRPGPRKKVEGSSEELLEGHKKQLREWLKVDELAQRGLTLTKVHSLLKRQGVQVSYSTLYRFAVNHFDFGRPAPTVRVADCSPGELAEVDFGRLGYIYDAPNDKKRLVYALVVVLAFSRHQYVHLSHRQKLDDFLEGMEAAWDFFGGVTSRVVLDNLRAAVNKADRYDHVFQRTFDEYSQWRGFVIDAALPRHATGKPHVERQVSYVRENFFRGESFLSLEHCQQEALRWCMNTAGMRIHGTTRLQPLVQFETYEKAALKPLTGERFDTPRWATPKVHPDFHVRFDYALYSVPYKYRGKKAVLRADSRLVRIYIAGKLVKTHPVKKPGKRSTDFNDYPSEKTPYAMRDANYLIAQARKRGKHLGLFTEHLLAGDFPWAKLRQAQKLLRLSDKYGNTRVEMACKRALSFELINVGRVQRIVELALEKYTDSSGDPPGQAVQFPLRFLRDSRSFTHTPYDKKEEPDADSKLP